MVLALNVNATDLETAATGLGAGNGGGILVAGGGKFGKAGVAAAGAKGAGAAGFGAKGFASKGKFINQSFICSFII